VDGGVPVGASGMHWAVGEPAEPPEPAVPLLPALPPLPALPFGRWTTMLVVLGNVMVGPCVLPDEPAVALEPLAPAVPLTPGAPALLEVALGVESHPVRRMSKRGSASVRSFASSQQPQSKCVFVMIAFQSRGRRRSSVTATRSRSLWPPGQRSLLPSAGSASPEPRAASSGASSSTFRIRPARHHNTTTRPLYPVVRRHSPIAMSP